MARVSISEAARLASVSRPTIYKLLKSGELSYTSVVKHGKSVKAIDTTELIRVLRCYGKYCTIKNAIPAMLKSIANGFMSKIPIDVENNPRTIILPTSPPTMRDKTV